MSPDGTVEHTGDNLTGEGEGDDEIIKVNLSAMSPDVERIVFPVSIYDADARRQSFGQVANAYIRVVNADNDAELTRFDLTEDASTETAMVFGELYRRAASGSSAPSARATRPACAGSPSTTASTSNPRQASPRSHDGESPFS